MLHRNRDATGIRQCVTGARADVVEDRYHTWLDVWLLGNIGPGQTVAG